MMVTVARAGDIPEGEARRFEVDGHEIAVVNLGEGRFRAVGDVCSHAQAYLHEGEVDAEFEEIECPRHGSIFDLNTGKPTSLPATTPVPVYEVTIDGDEVKVEIA
jgi:3-phenylpropionate/trans-cinnamate dioxygenase ferredoxin subunit